MFLNRISNSETTHLRISKTTRPIQEVSPHKNCFYVDDDINFVYHVRTHFMYFFIHHSPIICRKMKITIPLFYVVVSLIVLFGFIFYNRFFVRRIANNGYEMQSEYTIILPPWYSTFTMFWIFNSDWKRCFINSSLIYNFVCFKKSLILPMLFFHHFIYVLVIWYLYIILIKSQNCIYFRTRNMPRD